MATTKRKPGARGRKSPPAAKGPPRSRRRAPIAPEPPLQQGLLEMATIGAQSVLWLATVVVVFAALAAAAFGIWSLRPLPAYSSDRVTAGSPFGVTFRVENTSTWFALSRLKISCVLGRPETSSVEADGRFPARLEPGEAATFTCPFRATDDLDAALRSEIYFHSEYDVPLIGTLRLADNGGPFVLDTRLLPPRWTAKPGRD
jgi:hypothetical protein